jgi:hypothetical protein
MKSLRAIISVLVLTAFSAAIAQQPVEPPPKSAAGGSTLAATMQYIQKELNAVGKLSFVIHIFDQEEGNSTSKIIGEVSKVVADPASCTIHYHWWRSMHGDVVNDEDVSFCLRDVLGLSMLTNDEHEKLIFEMEKTSPDERQTLHMQFDPQVYLVIMRIAGDYEEGFIFADKKQAERVAKAMSHAVELCGGKKDKF